MERYIDKGRERTIKRRSFFFFLYFLHFFYFIYFLFLMDFQYEWEPVGDLHNYRRINIELHCHQWLLIVLCSSAIIIFNLSPQCFVPFNISHLLIRSIFHIKQIFSSNFFFSLFTFNTYPSFPLLLFLLYSFSGSKWSLLV